MIKKLLPTMIGAALTVGMTAAAADVVVFGHIDTSITNVDAEIDKFSVFDGEEEIVVGGSADDTNFNCTTCSVGFKGSEDLGNGLKAIFKLDFQFDTINRNANGSITDRDQWLGLAGNFGQVRVGSISTSYKSHGAQIDPLYRTVVQARDNLLQSNLHKGAGEEGQGRATNTARYDSPSWNGLKVTAHYTLDSDEGDGEDNNGYGIGASYQNGGLLVFGDYLTNDGDGDFDNNELSAWKLGGKFTINNFSVFGQYEDIENDSVGAGNFIAGLAGEDIGFVDTTFADVETEWWHVGATYAMGNNTLYAAYGQADHDMGSFNDEIDGQLRGSATLETDTISVGAVHAMSKRTSIYAAYYMIDGEVEDVDFEVDALALGMKHKF